MAKRIDDRKLHEHRNRFNLARSPQWATGESGTKSEELERSGERTLKKGGIITQNQ